MPSRRRRAYDYNAASVTGLLLIADAPKDEEHAHGGAPGGMGGMGG
jgi:chaperonin GroEL